MAASDDGETVDAFLERIASLKIKRDREDEERTRKLEEEIVQGRRERQARRAERARSLSPPKDPMSTNGSSFANSPTSSTPSQTIQPPVDLRPSPQPKPSFLGATMDSDSPSAGDNVASETSYQTLTPRNTSPTRSTQINATALSRSGTLSWQQRPSSRDSNSSRHRPFSGLSTELAPSRAPEPSTPERSEQLSRTEIAQSLGSKDPAWFRQTADRGIGSAAFRRNQDDPLQDTISARDRMRLPGMSRQSTAEPKKPPLPDAGRQRADSPVQDGSSQGAGWLDDRSKPSLYTSAALRAPLPLSSSQRLMPSESDAEDESSVRPTELSQQSKAFSDRPPSPTKGLGGFVQSAMMKRSDSVNKRWSTQAASGLKRGDSIAGQRGTLGTLAPVPLTRSGSPPREVNSSPAPPSSPGTYSRPTSSHSISTVSQRPLAPSQRDTTEPSSGTPPLNLDLDSVEVGVKPGKGTEQSFHPSGDSSKSMKSHEELSSSPTKTMDPKRWSPTKASWLESALSKPEPPKITSPKVDQPTWRSDLQKSKQSKLDASEYKSLTPSFEVVTQPGLMRSPPPRGHSRPLSIGGLPEGFSSGMAKNPPAVLQKPLSIREEAAQRNDSATIEPTNANFTLDSGAEPRSLAKQETSPDSRAAKTDLDSNVDQSEDSASKQKPPALKAKPKTPPKTDFRANLKSRQKDSQESASAEPEFKNVFGKLRRTETKNYVAPDVLKTNILTGKAGLNLTGGPQKTKRVDEFKESILSKKEAMKTGGGSINKKTEIGKGSSAVTEKPVALVPEALARRNQLSKSSSTTAAPVEMKSTVQVSISSKPPIKLPVDLPKRAPASIESANFKSSETKLHQLEQSKAVTEAAAPVSSDIQSPAANIQKDDVEPNDKGGSGKLANRMNPSLASILMRGPRSTTGSRNHSTEDLSSSISISARPAADDSHHSDEAQLIHMTKGRAKGPKRRLPKAENKSKEVDNVKPIVASKSQEVRKVSSPKPPSVGFDGAAPTGTALMSSTTSPHPSRPLATLVNQNEKVKPPMSKPLPKNDVKLAEDPETADKPRPPVAAKSLDLRTGSSPKSLSSRMEETGSFTSSDLKRPTTPPAARISSPGKLVIEREQAKSQAPILKDMKSEQIRDEPGHNLASKPQLPQKPTLALAGRVNGLGLEHGDSKQTLPKVSKSELPRTDSSPFVKRTAMVESPKRQTAASVATKEPSVAAGSPATRQMLEDFFDEHPKASDKADIDTHVVVSSAAVMDEKTKTLRVQIWEVNGDGKRQDMPPQQEHILYEESMYLCVHSLENVKGSKTTEAFLWCGDNVGEAAVEDAQLFCRKIARENGAKLELLKQGRETLSFIQAIGGIIITRRSKSSSLYMLRGRRHLGHVSFDEVDIDANNLCSGFPYLISARFGKLYLWKGKGSGADEVGCARLIGMDLGLTGEIEEVNEDDESPSFWEAALGTKSRVARSKWSEHWTLKGTPNQYHCRLFQIEVDNLKPAASFWTRRGSSPAKGTKTGIVQEITPFCQRDLEASHVFVLDAYFEIYVFVGSHAGAKSVEFVTALFFAQEYSILAASLQDRPLVPPCHVTLSEAPLDFRAVFRKWIPSNSPGVHTTTIPLAAAVEALV